MDVAVGMGLLQGGQAFAQAVADGFHLQARQRGVVDALDLGQGSSRKGSPRGDAARGEAAVQARAGVQLGDDAGVALRRINGLGLVPDDLELVEQGDAAA